MAEPTLDALARRVNRFERRLHWLVAFAVSLVGILVLAATIAPRFLPGRYQLVAPAAGLIHRLDTRTGKIEFFAFGPPGSAIEGGADRFVYQAGRSSDE